MLTAAPMPMTAAAMPRPMSRPLILRAPPDGAGRGPEAAGAPAGRGAGAPVFVAGRAAAGAAEAEPATERPGDPAVGGRGTNGAPPAVPGAAAGAAAAAGADEADGPPAGRVGSLIVGEDVGFGGRLMRTVSFLG